jgi:hypothetical protein
MTDQLSRQSLEIKMLARALRLKNRYFRNSMQIIALERRSVCDEVNKICKVSFYGEVLSALAFAVKLSDIPF